MTDRQRTCTFSRGGKCALSVPFSMCERCLAFHPRETDMEAFRERLQIDTIR